MVASARQPLIDNLLFDRQGRSITHRRWGELKSDDVYHRIGTATVGSAWISTVWLGINHEWRPGRSPITYETMIFGGPLDGTVERYGTDAQAQAGHRQWVTIARLVDRRRRTRRYKHRQAQQRRRHRGG